jgi:hypothetical protein
MNTYICLRITGDSFKPDEATSILDIKPNRASAKNSIHTTCTGKKIVAKFGSWAWDYPKEKPEQQETFKQKIVSLGRVFDGKKLLQVSELSSVEYVWVDIFILGGDAEDMCDERSVCFDVDIESILVFHELGIPVVFSIGVCFE